MPPRKRSRWLPQVGLLVALFLSALAPRTAPAMAAPAHQDMRVSSAVQPVPCAGRCWRPRIGTSWNWVLSVVPEPPFAHVEMYDIDGFDATAATVRALHRAGIKVACYLSAGSWERWRPDAGAYPRAVLGRSLSGWPGERWVDISSAGPKSALRAILTRRVKMCAAKGFDAIEFDNVDGDANDTGFALTRADQLAFNEMLANLAHRFGMAALLKNDVGQAARLVSWFDGELDEQCNRYHECGALHVFIAADKPVFNAEYQSTRSFCRSDRLAGFDGAAFDLALDGRRFLPCGTPLLARRGGPGVRLRR